MLLWCRTRRKRFCVQQMMMCSVVMCSVWVGITVLSVSTVVTRVPYNPNDLFSHTRTSDHTALIRPRAEITVVQVVWTARRFRAPHTHSHFRSSLTRLQHTRTHPRCLMSGFINHLYDNVGRAFITLVLTTSVPHNDYHCAFCSNTSNVTHYLRFGGKV